MAAPVSSPAFHDSAFPTSTSPTPAVGVRHGRAQRTLRHAAALRPRHVRVSWEPRRRLPLRLRHRAASCAPRATTCPSAAAWTLSASPANGRNFEYASEDPSSPASWSASSPVASSPTTSWGTLKHYALNDQETGRNTLNAIPQLARPCARPTCSPSRSPSASPHPAGVHVAPTTASTATTPARMTYTLNQVLKRDWGFKGFVLSDWGGNPLHRQGPHSPAASIWDQPGDDNLLLRPPQAGRARRHRSARRASTTWSIALCAACLPPGVIEPSRPCPRLSSIPSWPRRCPEHRRRKPGAAQERRRHPSALRR